MPLTPSLPTRLSLALLLGACVHVPPGSTILTVETEDPELARSLHLELWRVERAVEQVKVRYDLTDIAVEVVVKDMGGLGATQPALDESMHVQAAVVSIHERLFLDGHPDLDAILVGLFAHELVHGLQEARASRADLLEMGLQYERFLLDTSSEHLRDWVMHFEQLTDMTAIALGYAEELVHQKRASEQNLIQNHPKHVWDFYLKEHEIRQLLADEEELWRRIDVALERLALESLTEWMDGLRTASEAGA